MEAVWEALLGHFAARPAYFQLFDRYRLRPDAWLKIEALSVITPLVGSTLREARPDRQGCDVWFAGPEGERWLAVKGLITSYAGAGREVRQTLISVEEVAREMDKLRGLSTLAGGRPGLLLAAFPFGPHPRERDEWQSQLLRFEAKGFELAGARKIDLRPERECRVYLFA